MLSEINLLDVEVILFPDIFNRLPRKKIFLFFDLIIFNDFSINHMKLSFRRNHN